LPRRRIGADGKVHEGTAKEGQRRRRKREVWESRRYRRARFETFMRDKMRCRFCGEACVPFDPKLKPTAAHWPLSVEELLERGADPTRADYMVTAHAECHGRQDAQRQHGE